MAHEVQEFSYILYQFRNKNGKLIVFLIFSDIKYVHNSFIGALTGVLRVHRRKVWQSNFT